MRPRKTPVSTGDHRDHPIHHRWISRLRTIQFSSPPADADQPPRRPQQPGVVAPRADELDPHGQAVARLQQRQGDRRGSAQGPAIPLKAELPVDPSLPGAGPGRPASRWRRIGRRYGIQAGVQHRAPVASRQVVAGKHRRSRSAGRPASAGSTGRARAFVAVKGLGHLRIVDHLAKPVASSKAFGRSTSSQASPRDFGKLGEGILGVLFGLVPGGLADEGQVRRTGGS